MKESSSLRWIAFVRPAVGLLLFYKEKSEENAKHEVNEKTMALCIKGGKISAQILKAALTKLLAEIEKQKQQSKKMGGQNRCKRGKQSIIL